MKTLHSINDIRFRNSAPLDTDHPRIRDLAPHQDKLDNIGFDFFSYRELFERFVCESLIATGGKGLGSDLVELRLLSLGPSENHSASVVRHILGDNLHGNLRYSALANLFSLYDTHPAQMFFRKRVYLESEYFKQMVRSGDGKLHRLTKPPLGLLSAMRKEKIARERIRMLEKFRNAGNVLVPASKSIGNHHHFNYFDVPWAIDYYGYTKLRDGAHRRATLFYLGEKQIPTLVVNFQQLEQSDVGSVSQTKSIVSGFETFRHIVSQLNNL